MVYKKVSRTKGYIANTLNMDRNLKEPCLTDNKGIFLSRLYCLHVFSKTKWTLEQNKKDEKLNTLKTMMLNQPTENSLLC